MDESEKQYMYLIPEQECEPEAPFANQNDNIAFTNFDKSLAQDWYMPTENIIEFGAISKTRVVHLRNVLPKQYLQEIIESSASIFNTKRVALIICNSYDTDKRPLGRSVYNDAMLTYDRLIERDYEVYIVHNITKDEFQCLLKNALKQHLSKLTIYYIGHGARTQLRNSLIEYSSFICCDTPKPANQRNFLSSSTIHLLIKEYNTCEKLVLIADCCHSRSIFGVSDVDGISVVTACDNNEKARQEQIMEATPRQEHGLFTYYFWNYIDECRNSPMELYSKIKPLLKRKGQHCMISSVEEQLL